MSQVQNVTVYDLAPIEDILVEGIAKRERGKCEALHNASCPSSLCAGLPVAIFSCSCYPGARLVCRAGADYASNRMVTRGSCGACGEPIRKCWSVVMLP